MKIGDKIRFLDAVGGGVIKGFEGRDIVLVEDEDGFDVPVLRHNCVVIDSDQEKRIKGESTLQQPKANTTPDEPLEIEPADKPFTFKPAIEERKGGDKLNLYFCFEPVKIKELSKTEFDLHIVNDSNYYITFTFLTGENNIWFLRHTDTIEPNTRAFIQTFPTESLNELQHICVQAIVFKQEKTFILKQPINIEQRLNLTRFYKFHLFEPNDFFTTPVLTIPLVENDQPTGHTHNAIADRISFEKKEESKSPSAKIAAKANKAADEVVDLHADELLDTTAGMTPGDILEYQLDVFKKKMSEFCKTKGKRIVFIHGKGDGVLRSRIIQLLKRNHPHCSWQDASFREYGFGATLVIIH